MVAFSILCVKICALLGKFSIVFSKINRFSFDTVKLDAFRSKIARTSLDCGVSAGAIALVYFL